jgi:hypothetical protein
MLSTLLSEARLGQSSQFGQNTPLRSTSLALNRMSVDQMFQTLGMMTLPEFRNPATQTQLKEGLGKLSNEAIVRGLGLSDVASETTKANSNNRFQLSPQAKADRLQQLEGFKQLFVEESERRGFPQANAMKPVSGLGDHHSAPLPQGQKLRLDA